MSHFVDPSGNPTDFGTWYWYVKNTQQRQEVVTKDGVRYFVWSRFKGVGGHAWQTTIQEMIKGEDAKGLTGSKTYAGNEARAALDFEAEKARIVAAVAVLDVG